MEKWDMYTRDGKVTGITINRGEATPDGLYHLGCEVLVRHEDGSILCMKRAMSKQDYPGWFEATVGGAALAGEDKIQCIKRELREETGIVCDDFCEIGCHISDEDRGILYNFVCTVNCDKDSITLQEGETEDYKWMTEAEFSAFVNSGEMIQPQKKRLTDYFMTMKYIV